MNPQLFSRREFLRAGAAFGFAGCAGSFIPPAAAAEPAYQIGCYTRPWDQFEYRVALDGIAEAGYQYAGLMTAKGKSWVLIHVGSTPEEVAAIAGEVKKRGLKTLSIYGGDFPVTVNGLVAGMSVKDFLPPKEVMVTPGRGQVKFREVFDVLRKGGFTGGPLVVECLSRGDAPGKITSEARAARVFLEELIRQKG
jgi:sugar phosphate isomerase/epimerase